MTIGLLALLLLSGFAAGLFGSVLGLGGGIFIVPILVLAVGVPMHSAVATSLLCVIATSSGAAWKNIHRGFANVRLGVSLELWTVLGAIAGGSLAGRLSGSTLIAIFAAAMVVISILMAHGEVEIPTEVAPDDSEDDEPVDRFAGRFWDPSSHDTIVYQPVRIRLAMAISSLAGTLSGLLGIGGGILQVPTLVKLCGVPMKAAAATSNFMIGVTGVASALIYYTRGDFAPVVAAGAVLGVFGGSRAGALVAGHLRPALTRRLFAAVMLLVAAQMLLKAKGWWPA
ncbi:MAG TPA: sulfite exporter TauE/SafE family protein [Thermoanaerobaculia bacterium]|nr:sulfite exporter TauE/SafE family protein [Thermoanaerobaculia bacterium]